jgi:hypothetical protein
LPRLAAHTGKLCGFGDRPAAGHSFQRLNLRFTEHHTPRRDASAEAIDHNNPICSYRIIAIVSHTIEISSHDVTSWRR